MPAYYDVGSKNHDTLYESKWWKNTDLAISTFITSTTQSDVHGSSVDIVLDKFFFAASHPLQTRNTTRSDAGYRNVLEIRFLRVDNDMTTNGRDVFVPYVVKSSNYARN